MAVSYTHLDTLLKEMNIGTHYHTLGLFSSRTGAAGQITAVDDAVKATGTEVLSIEFPRDTKGWGGHGNYIVIGGNDVSDAVSYTHLDVYKRQGITVIVYKFQNLHQPKIFCFIMPRKKILTFFSLI